MVTQAASPNVLVGYYNDPATGLATVPPGKVVCHYMYLSTNGRSLVLLGQKVYGNLAEATANNDKDNPAFFTTTLSLSSVFNDQLLRYALLIPHNVTNLATSIAANNSALIPFSRFGAGTSGGASTATTDLQTAFNNSTLPQITTTPTKPEVQIKGGTGADSDRTLSVLNNIGVTTATVRANGTAEFKGLSTNYASSTLDYNVFLDDSTVNISAATASRTVNLPLVANSPGRVITIKKTDNSANTVTVKGAGSELVDGANTYVLTNQYDSVTVQSIASEWVALSNG